MKNTILPKSASALAVLVFLSACSQAPERPAHYDPAAMPGMPCHQMGETWMGDCEFDEAGNVIEKTHSSVASPNAAGDFFSGQTGGLPDAKPSQVVELKNGDTYKMSADMVRQEIGNRVIKRLAYNGQIPGPLLKVDQGSEITVEFTNNLDVETTIHSHGLRLDSAFDGVPDVTQKPIKPGESFTYQLKFPDAGMYWYHPHIREDYAQELGLYGNYWVEPNDPNYWAAVDREENWIVDDLLLNDDQPAFSTETTDHALMGRFGNIMLLNNEENPMFKAKKGEVVRFYLTNVANTRVFSLGIEGVKTKLVGGDSGRAEREQFENSFLIAPSERMIFEAEFDEEGRFDIVHKTPEKAYTLGQVVVSAETVSVADFGTLRDNSADFATLRADMDSLLRKAPDKSLRLSIEMMGMEGGMGMMGGMHHGEAIEWEDTMAQMNQASTSKTVTWKLIDEATGKANMDIDWSFKKGELVKIRIFNDPASMHPMQHPIHFHGQRFVVLSRGGATNDNLQWKDTTLVKTGETVDLLVEMSNPGAWMAHCHIAEHLHSGMMLGFTVKD